MSSWCCILIFVIYINMTITKLKRTSTVLDHDEHNTGCFNINWCQKIWTKELFLVIIIIWQSACFTCYSLPDAYAWKSVGEKCTIMGRFDFTSYSDTDNGLKDKLVEAVCLQVVYQVVLHVYQLCKSHSEGPPCLVKPGGWMVGTLLWNRLCFPTLPLSPERRQSDFICPEMVTCSHIFKAFLFITYNGSCDLVTEITWVGCWRCLFIFSQLLYFKTVHKEFLFVTEFQPHLLGRMPWTLNLNWLKKKSLCVTSSGTTARTDSCHAL